MAFVMSSSTLSTTRNRRHFTERRPAPSHRHSGPSAPWPWINTEDDVDKQQLDTPLPPIPPICTHEHCGGSCWRGYPQSRFPNWTPAQVKRSKIAHVVEDYQRDIPSVLYHVDVDKEGLFTDSGNQIVSDDTLETFWDRLTKGTVPSSIRVRALFIERMNGPVLQMLGTVYNIEPFFFSSALSWIPSRFQEGLTLGVGDHITISLTFLRARKSVGRISRVGTPYSSRYSIYAAEDRIDTLNPLYLNSEETHLALDLLAVHLIRNVEGNTIISYHDADPDLDGGTTARYLHERIRFAGQSVYWQTILQKCEDPTFVLLLFIWHAMYAWDEALERLYNHICDLEMQVINTSEMKLTRELHIIRAHLLHYTSLLQDLKKTVRFVLHTSNPAMGNLPKEDQDFSCQVMEKECNHLLIEIERLEMSRQMLDKRLKNVMNLVFSSVNIDDSSRMQKLTEAAVRDSAAYMSMIFLPASFVAAIFGMNIGTLVPDSYGTLPHYFEVAAPLTFLTVWIVMTFQSKYIFGKNQPMPLWKRLLWPILLFRRIILTKEEEECEKKDDLSTKGV